MSSSALRISTVQPSRRAPRLHEDGEILDPVAGGIFVQVPLASILAVEMKIAAQLIERP
jgi:hypothetical protein